MNIKRMLALHRVLLWLGGITLLLFALTGALHPIMSWTGPQATTMRPPSLEADQAVLQQAIERLTREQREPIALAQLVPYRDQTLVQLSTHLTEPRRYLSLRSLSLHSGDDGRAGDSPVTDTDMARWLASWYSGEPETEITAVHFQNRFDSHYPSVNRLLPVYRVDFASGLSLHVHTESLSLAGITNPYRTRLQAVFRHLHSWQWLDPVPLIKLPVMTLLLGSALLLTLTGLWLLLKLPLKGKRRGVRRWHYALSWVLVVPVTLYLLTGIYHFGYKYLQPESAGLTLPPPTQLPDNLALGSELSEEEHFSVNSAALVRGEGEHWYWRLSLHNPDQSADRHSRFAGQAAEAGSVFIGLSEGAPALDDKRYAALLAGRFVGIEPEEIRGYQRVTHFGPDYDFRNKRLPVWQIEGPSSRAFIDTASGQLVEQQFRSTRWERYSFSLVHKWGLLQPLFGRDGRDALVVLLMVLVLALAGLGFTLRIKTRKLRR